MKAKHKAGAPKAQAKPNTPPSRAESRTSRPAKGRTLAMPAMPQPVAQSGRKGKR